MGLWDDEPSPKRTLSRRDREFLWERAEKRCQNPKCRKKLEEREMQVGHKRAASKGGSATLANCVCLCYNCNRKMGTDSWATFLKKQGVEDPKAKLRAETKVRLVALSVRQLRSLASKHHVKVTGRTEEGLFSSRTLAPTKSQYVTKLAGVVTSADLRSVSKESEKTPTGAKRKTPKKRDNS